MISWETIQIPSSVTPKTKGMISLTSVKSCHTQIIPASHRSNWKPAAFRILPQLAAISIAWSLIVVLQILLIRSQKYGGIILTEVTEEIPAGKASLYLYLPTIIALLFSIVWAWIDLQIKRLEPYYQMSKKDGAWGKDSLLLSYPFDFLPLVPWKAFRNRHWAVFWCSISIIFVTWGIVPLQAGIFATETIQTTFQTSFVRSANFVPANKQSDLINLQYIHSAHGIIWLNESLPPYMTREYALASFRPRDISNYKEGNNQTWTSETTLYSVDMNCETPKILVEDTQYYSPEFDYVPQNTTKATYTSSNGCRFSTDYLRHMGNETIGPNKEYENNAVFDTKEFSSAYIGYYSTDWSDYYLQGDCPDTANHTFMALFTRNKISDNDPPQNVTRLFCAPFYYQQKVNATISAQTKTPLHITAVREKEELPAEKWNSSFFESQMNTGINNAQNRGALPLTVWPDQMETLSTLPLSLGNYGTNLPNVVGYMIGASRRPLEELLDPEALKTAYEATYRIIFARSMLEILDQELVDPDVVQGSVLHTMSAIVIVSVFVHIVQGLLGVVSLCSIMLLIVSSRRHWNLRSDPTTIASVQALIAENVTLLNDFSKFDRASMEQFEKSISNKRYKLEYTKQGATIIELENHPLHTHVLVRTDSDESQLAKAVRPPEFRSYMMLPFISLLIALAITLGVLFLKSQPHGLARPSNNAIMRQVVENYIPTAIATLIEPVWVLINRLICLLQPFEELRGGNALARKSIDVDYSSLPAQLVVFKALRLSHFKLAATCLMALLANVLAIAFSGMINERAILVPHAHDLLPPYESRFVNINGTVGPDLVGKARLGAVPSGAFTGGLGINQFMVAESNYTANTPLPPWTDDSFMYVPFMTANSFTSTIGVEGRTMAFGATIECDKIDQKDYSVQLYDSKSPHLIGDFLITSTNDSGIRVTCVRSYELSNGCQTGKLAIEFVLRLRAQNNASRADQEFCEQTVFLGYVRDTGTICKNTKISTLNDESSVFVGCRPKLVAGEADIRADINGRVQSVSKLSVTSSLSRDFFKQHFSNGAENLIRQSNGYIFHFLGGAWHNDLFASDFLNYFIVKQANDSRLISPGLPLPTLEDITERLRPTYTKLFAIWIGVNQNKLLVPRDGSTMPIKVRTNEPEIRIFLSYPLFVIAEVILGVYIIIAICVYLWRPGRFLPRMPISIGATVATFSASEAIHDMRDTSFMTKRARRKYLEGLGRTYGYGTFIGADGKLHEGIEKMPFVSMVPIPGILKKIQIGFSQKRLGLRRDIVNK